MEIERYHICGYELGPEAKQAYLEGIEKLEHIEDTRERLKISSEIFEALGKSTYPPNRSIEWAEEIIKAYRNLGEIVGSLLDDLSTEDSELSLSELEERVSNFENNF